MYDKINKVRAAVESLMMGESSGHDWTHVQRVVALATRLAWTEARGSLVVIELAALLHDVGDAKFHGGDHSVGPRMAGEIMLSAGIHDPSLVDAVQTIVGGVSWSKGDVLTTVEGQIVQDADRLDAIGAIGIARCFAYGGSAGRTIQESYAHLEEKVILIRGRMNTQAGRHIADERHKLVVEFMGAFAAESRGKSS